MRRDWDSFFWWWHAHDRDNLPPSSDAEFLTSILARFAVWCPKLKGTKGPLTAASAVLIALWNNPAEEQDLFFKPLILNFSLYKFLLNSKIFLRNICNMCVRPLSSSNLTCSISNKNPIRILFDEPGAGSWEPRHKCPIVIDSAGMDHKLVKSQLMPLLQLSLEAWLSWQFRSLAWKRLPGALQRGQLTGLSRPTYLQAAQVRFCASSSDNKLPINAYGWLLSLGFLWSRGSARMQDNVLVCQPLLS